MILTELPYLAHPVLPFVSPRSAEPYLVLQQQQGLHQTVSFIWQVERGLWGQLAIQAPKEELQQRRQQAQQRLADSLASNKQAQLDRKKALDK